MIKNAHYHTPFYFEDIRKDLYMQFFRHFSYRSFLTRAVMGISALCLFASQGLSVSAATIKEENIAHNQALAIQSNEVANWPTGPVVSAESAILMDADTGAILYAKNIHQQEYPASTTKILTTLIASERCSMDEIVDFSYDAVHDIDPGSNHIAIDPGEQLTMEECLNAILIRSANEVSFAVAEHISGTTWQDFAPIMNERAKELGCVDSNFVNPNGLPNEDHYTSAYDLAMIGKAFFANEALCKMTMTHMLHILPSERQPDDIMEVNKMELIPGGKYAYPYLVGCKTGYTDVARSTLVSCAEKDGMKLICVVMKDENPNYYEDTITLFDYGFSNFQRVNISQTETKYNIENVGSFYSGNDIFGNSKPILELNQTDSITLPNTITFQDAVSSISYDNTEPGQVAVITYTYNDVVLGTASLDFTAAEKGSSVFRENTAETTESAEESGATDETQSGTTTTEADNTETTETAGDNTGNNGGIPTVAQETSPEEENSTSGGPAVIFINVVKVFFCIVGIAVLIFLALLLRTFFKNYHFAHRSTRLTWRFNRRRNRSRSRYRSVDQDLRNRRKEAIRQAKKRQKPKKSSHFRG